LKFFNKQGNSITNILKKDYINAKNKNKNYLSYKIKFCQTRKERNLVTANFYKLTLKNKNLFVINYKYNIIPSCKLAKTKKDYYI
jgi:hypothetical protein